MTDGYGNAQVHKYTPDGKYMFSWGTCGIGEGEFNLPHNIHCDADGWLYVADRENHRIQVFDGNGKYETQWASVVHRPSALHMTTGTCPLCFVGEVGPYLGSQSADSPILGHASASFRTPENCWHASGSKKTRTVRALDSSCRRTAWPWTRVATSMSARCRSRPGRRCFRVSRWPEQSAQSAEIGEGRLAGLRQEEQDGDETAVPGRGNRREKASVT